MSEHHSVFGNILHQFDRVRSLWKRVSIFCPKLKNWWIYPLGLFGFLKKGNLYTFRYRNGMNVSFRAGTYDTLINFEIFGCGEYAHYFMSDVGTFHRIIDLGAQTGVFTLSLLAQNKLLQVTCVEVTTENFQVLKRNIEQNGFSKQVALIHKAVWGKTGESLSLHMSKHNSGSHSVVIDDSGRVNGETVQTISLKDVVGAETCDVLKIDIEGAEYDVLYGTDSETFSRIRHIVMEAHFLDEKRNAPAIETFLVQRGFEVIREGKHLWAKNRESQES